MSIDRLITSPRPLATAKSQTISTRVYPCRGQIIKWGLGFRRDQVSCVRLAENLEAHLINAWELSLCGISFVGRLVEVSLLVVLGRKLAAINVREKGQKPLTLTCTFNSNKALNAIHYTSSTKYMSQANAAI